MKPYDSKQDNSKLELQAHEQEELMKYMDISVPKELNDRLASRLTKMKSPIFFRKSWIKMLIATAASIMIVLSLGMGLSSAFAAYVKSIFMESGDPGLKEAFENGHSKTVGKQVTDQGVTVRVKEVVADLNRISVSYDIVNEKGESMDPSLVKSDSGDPIYLTNLNGEKLHFGGHGGPVWDRKGKQLGGVVTFDLPKNIANEKQFIFHLHFTNIGEITNEIGTKVIQPGVKGKWVLQFPIDLRKEKNASKEIKLDAILDWKHEIKLTFDKLVLSPSLSRLFYHVDQSEKLMQLPSQDADDFKVVDLQYYITDEHNKKVAIYGTDDFNSGAETTNKEIQHPPFPKSKYYVFHLTGMSYATVANETFSISSKSLPVTKSTSVGKIMIKSMKKVNGNTVITIEGERSKDIDSYGWVVRDEKGQVKEMFTHGSENGKSKQGKTQSFTEDIGIVGEPTSGKIQLQLIAVKKYHATNWSFKIKSE
ncbi:DUF4179 domain-containing protein [Shimazuella sp. AN120528]|uniref:DUF4179 domain-containing protein n=1 Tax=Shimazuella soli TaxID=1892854 RepID=UPI001F103312|nr:DUF4179 domain-containing protein [Shimazuella soli]MCH5585516.1 DUF4179 domain-containing protein [Shimazuella soli]